MKVLNFGSLNIDYVYAVEHFVRPGETISSKGMKRFCGGKGLNQSVALSKAGAQVYHAGRTGADGQMLIDQLKKDGVNTDFVDQTSEASGHAIIQVDERGQNCILLFSGANGEVTKEQVEKVISAFSKGDILLLQNEVNCLDVIIERAYSAGMTIVLNPSPINDSLLKLPLDKVTYFVLNEIEGNELTGETEPDEIVKELKRRYPRSIVVLTLGKRGVLYVDGENTYTHGIYQVPVVDTTAAGDTFTGFFIGCISKGMSVPESLEIASKASSIAVSRAGASVSIPMFDEVAAAKLIPVK